MNRLRPLHMLLIPLTLAGVCSLGFAQGPVSPAAVPAEPATAPSKNAAGDGKPARNAKPAARAESAEVSITPAREASALTFAKLHHPELSELLLKLQKRNSKQYEAAVRDLSLASERLARLRERTPELYDVSLELWKTDSRIRLLAARLSMSGDKAVEAELQATLEKRGVLRLQQLRFERERLTDRLQKLDEQIEELEQDPQGVARRDLLRLQNSVQAQWKSKPQGSPPSKGVTVPVRAPQPESD